MSFKRDVVAGLTWLTADNAGSNELLGHPAQAGETLTDGLSVTRAKG